MSVPSRIAWLVLHLGSAGSGRACGPLSFWFLWQWLTDRYYRAQPARPGAFLKYCVQTYQGPQLALADGTIVSPGDRIAELHLDNGTLSRRLTAVKGEGRVIAWTWLVAKEMAADLAALGAPGRLGPEIKAIHGLTLLAPAARRLGFEVNALPKSRWHDLTGFFMLGLLAIYNPDGRRRLAPERNAYPAEIWMGRRTLASRYENAGRSSPE